MTRRTRGRPTGVHGPARMLSRSELRAVLRGARSRNRHAARAEAALALSIGAGLRPSEIATIKWSDVYDENGEVRNQLQVAAAYARRPRMRTVFLSASLLRQALERYGQQFWLLRTTRPEIPLLLSRKGGAMTAQSIARFLQARQCRTCARTNDRSGKLSRNENPARDGNTFRPSRADEIAGSVSSLALRDKQRGNGANRNACPRREAPLTQCVEAAERKRYTLSRNGQSVCSAATRKDGL